MVLAFLVFLVLVSVGSGASVGSSAFAVDSSVFAVLMTILAESGVIREASSAGSIGLTEAIFDLDSRVVTLIGDSATVSFTGAKMRLAEKLVMKATIKIVAKCVAAINLSEFRIF